MRKALTTIIIVLLTGIANISVSHYIKNKKDRFEKKHELSINPVTEASINNDTTKTIDKIAAVVGSTVILQSDIDKQYADYIAQGNPDDAEIKCIIMQRLLTQKILSQQ